MFRFWSFVVVAIAAISCNQVAAREVDCVIGEVDLAFVIDASNSIGFNNFFKLKTFLSDFLDHSSVDDGAVRVGTVTFSTAVEVEFKLNKYKKSSQISNHISKLKYTAGATNIAGGLNETRNVLFKKANGDREDVPNVVVLITDGQSNINKVYTIPYAKQLKDDGALIYALAIGKELRDSHQEILDMVSKPAKDHFQLINSYKDLLDLKSIIFSKICPVIEDCSVFKPGAPCNKNGAIVEKKCRTFKCIDKKWTKIGYTGCISKGRCIKWGEGRDEGCYQYQCFKAGQCKGDLCEKYDYRLINAGCLVDGKCIGENKVVEDVKACMNYKCISKVKNEEVCSDYVMVGKECTDPDGKCRPIGYTYKEHCIEYKCEISQFMGIMQAEFIPNNIACKHEGKCIPFGGTIKEVCDTFICGYDDKSMGYELMLESQGCEHNGECLEKNEKRFDKSSCTNFVCAFSKKQNRLVLKERIAGCKGDDGSCAGKGDIITQKGCIKYKCDKDGSLKLVEAGCKEDGECKPVGSVWRRPGECAKFKCVMGDCDAGSIETDIEEYVECHDFNGNCIKPGDEFVDHCKTFRCKDNGKLERVEAKCEYNGKCYAIGKNWIDRKLCKHVFCKADPGLGAIYNRRKFGCKDDEGNCYAPGESFKAPGTCRKFKCYDDHVLRREVCEYKDKCYPINAEWVDMEDCLSIFCFRDDFTGEAEMSTSVYGCLEEGICKKPGDSYVKDCQTYECTPCGGGFKIVESQCPWKQGCKSLNQTWFDKKTCRKYGCFEDDEGLDIEEITYGCRDMDDKCIKDSTTVEKDQCIKYECNNGNLVPTYVGCEYEFGCLDLNKFKVDEKKCIKYKCVMSKSGDSYVATKIKEVRGCLDHDKCYFPGAKKEEDCSTYVCTRDGTFKLSDPQCEFAGQCRALDSTWGNEEKCKRFKCELSKKTGLPVVKSWVWGCRGKNKCYKYGTIKRLQKCVTHICEKTDCGPRFVPHKIGCPSGPKCRKCKALDQSWVNRKACLRETCTYEEGNMYPEVIQSPYGCFDHKGNCRPFGSIITDDANPCIKYECTGFGYFSPIATGCSCGGKCRKPGTVWEDKDTCTKYRCKQENVGNNKVIMHVIEIPGCRDIKGNCMKDGEKQRIECTDYLCDTSAGGLVITSEGCMNCGECKPLGSSWLDPKSCITYQCEYDPLLKDLFIVEKQLGCQGAGGKCFNKGEKKKNDCNKFVCNAKGNFQVTKAGCEWNGKCYDIDESWQEGCVWYKCNLIKKGSNYVETKITETHGCIGKNGKCFKPKEVYKDGCLKYECKPGGQFKQTSFGCVGFDGSCIKPGQTVDNDCNKYQCDRFSLCLQPVDMSCSYNGECKDMNSTWFDKETCLGYKCVYDPQTNDVDIIERISGCQVENKCIRPGARKNGKDCIKYQCKKGNMVTTEVGCEYKGKCIPLNKVIKEGCSWKKCVIAQKGPTFIDTKLVTEHGCLDCFHHCHKVGDEFTQGCHVTECMPGGFTKTIENRCMTPSGTCIGYGDSYQYSMGQDNATYVCGELGDLEPIEEDHTCRMKKNGRKFDIGQETTVDCIRYRCMKTIDSAEFIPVYKQCRDDDGKCRDTNEIWYNKDKKDKYTCKNEKGVPTITVEYGCCHDGKFYGKGERWEEDCATYCCQIKNTNKGLIRGGALLKGQCKDSSGECHPTGSVWNEKVKENCFKMKCTVKNGIYSADSIRQICKDADGKCHDIGESGFDVKMGSKMLYGCTCNRDSASKQIKYNCKSNAK